MHKKIKANPHRYWMILIGYLFDILFVVWYSGVLAAFWLKLESNEVCLFKFAFKYVFDRIP